MQKKVFATFDRMPCNRFTTIL